MKRLIIALAVAGGFSFLAAEYNVGDTVSLYLNNIRITMTRDTVPSTAHIYKKGTYCYVAIMDTHRILASGIDTTVTLDSSWAYAKADTLFNTFEDEIAPNMLSDWNISWDDLNFPDPGDKRVMIVVAPLLTIDKGDASGTRCHGLAPVLGYFNPYDLKAPAETTFTNHLPMVVFNGVRPTGFIANKEAYPKGFLAYLFGLYTLYSIDPDDEFVPRVGMAMFMAHGLYNMVDGFMGGTANRAFGKMSGGDMSSTSVTDTAYFTNVYLYDAVTTRLYLDPFVTREADRERLLTWFAFVQEKLGHDFLVSAIHDTSRLLRYIIQDGFAAQGYEDFYKAVEEWALNAWLHGKGFSGYGFSSFSADSVLFTKALNITETNADGKGSLAKFGMAYYYNGVAGMSFHFNGDFRAKFTNSQGDSVSSFAIYLADLGAKTVTEVLPDSLNHLVTQSLNSEGQYELLVFNRSTQGWRFYLGGQDNKPVISDMMVLQNPVIFNRVDVYLVSKSLLFGGAAAGDTAPVVMLQPADTSYHTDSLILMRYATGDSFYIYYDNALMEFKNNFGQTYSGDVHIRFHRAMSRFGWLSDYTEDDTVGILNIGLEGGSWALLGGDVLIDVPEGAFGNGAYVIVDRFKASTYFQDESRDGTVYSLGTPSLTPLKPIRIELPTEGKKDLWWFNGSDWEKVESYASEDGSRLVAWVDRLGLFSLGKPGSVVPDEFSFFAPSVVRGQARIYLSLPQASEVQLSVYDASGRLVSRLYNGTMDAGNTYITWNTRASSGTSVAPGVYFYELRVNGKPHTVKTVVTR